MAVGGKIGGALDFLGAVKSGFDKAKKLLNGDAGSPPPYATKVWNVGEGIQRDSTQVSSVNTAMNGLYTVQIFSTLSNGELVSVLAYLPERVNVSIGSEYQTPFANLTPAGLGEGLGAGVLTGVFGIAGLNQAMTMRVWQSSTGMTVSLPLVFVSDTDPRENFQNIMNLYKLNVPQAPNGKLGQLLPPGPNFDGWEKLKKISGAAGREVASLVTGGDNNFTKEIGDILGEGLKGEISVAIGQYLFFDSVTFDSVDVDFESILAGGEFGGRPWKAEVTVQFTTLFNPSLEDLYKMFRMDNPNAKADGSSANDSQTPDS